MGVGGVGGDTPPRHHLRFQAPRARPTKPAQAADRTRWFAGKRIAGKAAVARGTARDDCRGHCPVHARSARTQRLRRSRLVSHSRWRRRLSPGFQTRWDMRTRPGVVPPAIPSPPGLGPCVQCRGGLRVVGRCDGPGVGWPRQRPYRALHLDVAPPRLVWDRVHRLLAKNLDRFPVHTDNSERAERAGCPGVDVGKR